MATKKSALMKYDSVVLDKKAANDHLKDIYNDQIDLDEDDINISDIDDNLVDDPIQPIPGAPGPNSKNRLSANQ